MSSYTPADIRKIIDDLDDILRAAIKDGNIEAVFTRERGTLVSKMCHSCHV